MAMAQTDPFETPADQRVLFGADPEAAWSTARAKANEIVRREKDPVAAVAFVRSLQPRSGADLAKPFIDLLVYSGDVDGINAGIEYEAGPHGGGAMDIVLLAHSPSIKPADIGF